MGNGYVFSSAHLSDDQALAELDSVLLTRKNTDPTFIPFTTGHVSRFWSKNCLALGLAAGFLEPLESTSIHLIQSSLMRFVDHFPRQVNTLVNADEFNRITSKEYLRIRDFIVLHYSHSGRKDTPFWKSLENWQIPQELQHKIEVFKSSAKVIEYDQESFMEPSWLSLFLGLGVLPDTYSVMADRYNNQQLEQLFDTRKREIDKLVSVMPNQKEYLSRLFK